MTQTFATLRRQQTDSCKGETPAGKANRKCLGKGTVYTSAPFRCAVSDLRRVIKSQSVGPQQHSSWKFDGGGLKLSP